MRRPLPALLLVAAILAIGGIGAWLAFAPGEPAERPATPRGEDRSSARAPRPLPPPAPGAPEGLRTRRFGPDEDHAPLPGTTGPAIPEELRRPDATPLESERFVEDKVVALLLVIDPTLDLAAVAHVCTDDGRHCTFEGPWLGDDFVKRWVQAISAGDTSLEDLEGVRFSNLAPRERADGTRGFVLEAHAP